MGWIGPEGIAAWAQQVERDGWDGMRVFDTQCLQGEAFVMMTSAATATTTLNLSIATSNPVTRHPSVAASAIASVACIAGGRVACGIGRGDSASAYGRVITSLQSRLIRQAHGRHRHPGVSTRSPPRDSVPRTSSSYLVANPTDTFL